MQIDVKTLMDEQGISRYDMAQRIGISYPTMCKIYAGVTESIKFDILDGLCHELRCTPNDVLVHGSWISNEDKISMSTKADDTE